MPILTLLDDLQILLTWLSQNLTLRDASAVEDRPFGFYECIAAGPALETLSARLGLAELVFVWSSLCNSP